MRWPFRYTRHPSDAEGIAKAKAAEEMAALLREHAKSSELEHADILRRNNLGPKIHRALGGH